MIDLWIEGFSVSGNRSVAQHIGSFDTTDFATAVEMWSKRIDSKLVWDGSYYTVWGCRIFDNELDARKSFG